MDVLIDVDGVVADLHTEWIRRYNEKWKDTLKYDDVKTWGIHEYCKPESGRDIYKILDEPDLYENVPLIDGALEGVNRIRDMGHRILYVTAYFNYQKLKWLFDNGFLKEFGYKGENPRMGTASEVCMINEKSWIKGDVLIDDRENNLKGFDGILFAQPWNEDNSGDYPRISGWSGVTSWLARRAITYGR